MISHRQEKQMMLIAVIGFSAQFFCALLSMICWPPDYSGEIPVYAPESNMMIELGLALLIAASTMMGIRLAEEKKVPAAGFTMLAISAGVMMASLFETTAVTTHESYEKSYYIVTSSYFLYLPAMILISTYEDFKKWLRYLGIISSIPLMAASVLFLFHYRNFVVLESIGMIGYILLFITQLFWAVNVYSNYKKKIQTEVKR